MSTISLTINGWLDWSFEAPDPETALEMATARAQTDLDPGEYTLDAYQHPYEGGRATTRIEV